MCKMKRAQQDHGSSTSTRNLPRVSPPSTTANSTASRPRRANDYPPLSHQTQIMKAVRRSVALPSLSLSVPPSPAQAMTMSSEGSVEEFSLVKDERVKAVAFSEPEDEEPSDDSSICQSPSWEQYSQKKKKPKKPKKETNQKAPKEKEETAAKKRSNRLIKSAPIDLSSIKPLTTSDRSISAPELSTSVQSSKMNSHSLAAEAQVALGKHHAHRNEQGPVPRDKPKSRGFLSGFRLQHGNVAAARELVAARKSTEEGAEAGADEDEPLRSIQYETIPVQQPIPVRPMVEQNIPKSRKPPSIRSIISNSDHSLSSQERKNLGGHTPTGLGHGRSQSLLSSTLNKLRGPSYLYHHSSGDGSANDPSKHTNSSQDFAPMHDNPTDMSIGRSEKIPGGAELANLDHSQQLFDFAFPSKHKRVNTEPGPEIAPRGRQPRPRKIEAQKPNTGEEIPVLRPSGGRRVQTEVPQPSTRDTVMALVAAQERQSQTARITQQNRSNIVGDGRALGFTESQQSAGKAFDGKHTVPRRQKGDVSRSRNTYAATGNISGMGKSADREGKVTSASSRNERPDTGDGRDPDDDQISVDTYASTIRPVSRSHNLDSAESGEQEIIPSSRGSGPPGRAIPPGTLEMGPEREPVPDRFFGDLITFEKDVSDILPQPLEPHRDVDYFASFSDSYLPPVLDLRSPGTGQQLLPRFPFRSDPDEDTGYNLMHGHSRKDYVGQVPNMNEGQQKSARTAGSRLKGIGKALAKEPKDSPRTSAQHSDSEVSIFEHPSSSSGVAKATAGAEIMSASASRSQHIDPSLTTSERSSSSTCDDAPPSPSSATTPDSSRPQSRKGGVISQTESSHIAPLEPTLRGDGRTSRGHLRNALDDISEGIASRGTETDASIGGSSYSEAAMAMSPEQQPTHTRAKVGVLNPGPSIDATPTLVGFADPAMQGLSKEGEEGVGEHPARALPPRTQSALDLHSTTKLTSQASRPQRLHLEPNGIVSSVSLPHSPPADLTEEVMPRKSALRMSQNNSANGPESSATISVGAAYLQEARKTAPVTTASSSRALRPHFLQKHSSGSVASAVSAGNRAEPLAKMLVECCNCHFFHDMPSRVYECMAKPDSVVEDKLLGVSAAITTMVRCPWCAHGMTTQCCSGYAAVVYLKEKLHGK